MRKLLKRLEAAFAAAAFAEEGEVGAARSIVEEAERDDGDPRKTPAADAPRLAVVRPKKIARLP